MRSIERAPSTWSVYTLAWARPERLGVSHAARPSVVYIFRSPKVGFGAKIRLNVPMLVLGHAPTRPRRPWSCVQVTSGSTAPLATLGCCKPGRVRIFSDVFFCRLFQSWVVF